VPYRRRDQGEERQVTTAQKLQPSAAIRAPRCDGCKHLWYSAPGGLVNGHTAEIRRPHIRCLHFSAYVPCVIERRRGCDGTMSNDWVGNEVPAGCPTFDPPQVEMFA
jgi:hypothetical protein